MLKHHNGDPTEHLFDHISTRGADHLLIKKRGIIRKVADTWVTIVLSGLMATLGLFSFEKYIRPNLVESPGMTPMWKFIYLILDVATAWPVLLICALVVVVWHVPQRLVRKHLPDLSTEARLTKEDESRKTIAQLLGGLLHPFVLENEFQRHLANPRVVASPEDLAEVAGRETSHRRAEIGVVQCVKELPAQLQTHSLADAEVPQQRSIPHREAVCIENVSSGVTPGIECIQHVALSRSSMAILLSENFRARV